MRLSRLPLLALLLMLILGGCGSEDGDAGQTTGPPEFRQDGTLTFRSPDGTPLTTIQIEIADSEAERATGLMRRRAMPFNQGMLFVFDQTGESGMWMKNTPMPLDIIFVAPDSTVINVVKRTTPFSLDSILPTAPKRYVVEVRAGFATRHGIRPGVTIDWERGAG